MTDKITGWLEIGVDAETLEVIVSFPETENDTAHHVTFSANQARELAKKLNLHAADSDRRAGMSVN